MFKSKGDENILYKNWRLSLEFYSTFKPKFLNKGLSPNDKKRQRRETLETRLQPSDQLQKLHPLRVMQKDEEEVCSWSAKALKHTNRELKLEMDIIREIHNGSNDQ